MIVVIQCAGGKRPVAGHLRRRDGRRVVFVADPDKAPRCTPFHYARPDDIADSGVSWRTELLRYNDAPDGIALGLLPAWGLYRNGVYRALAERYGADRLYILSAGWGLVRADFPIPYYDITFSRNAQEYARRRKSDRYDDFRMLPANADGPVAFLVGKDYAGLASALSGRVEARKILFHNSDAVPDAPGFETQRYVTRRRTNWHYECAEALIRGEIAIR